MRKTKAERGKPAVFRLKEDEEQHILDWIDAQTVYADSVRYLIQKEIAENGVRNLQLYIPQIRNVETVRELLQLSNKNVDTPDRVQVERPLNQVEEYHKEKLQLDEGLAAEHKQSQLPSAPPLPEATVSNESSMGISESFERVHKPVADSNKSIDPEINTAVTAQTSTSELIAPPKRKAKKTFDANTINSYQ